VNYRLKVFSLLETPNPDAPRRNVSFHEAFRYWLTLGFINFGGPAGQIALMHRDLVERRGWISEERFLHALNYCMLLPGPEAKQLAIYIGWLLHGTRGGIIAGVFFVLPSIFVLLLLSYIYAAYGRFPIVAGTLAGVKPVVVAVVIEAIVRIGRRALKRPEHFVIAALGFILIYFLRVPFPLIVLGAGIAGLLISRTKGEESSQPSNTEFFSVTTNDESRSRFAILRVLGTGLVLWLVPFALLVTALGWSSLHTQLYRFFTLAAFVTFGGAYAVLAYVTQAAVESYGWLTHAQAVDGLALAETTPGPLIMVLQFVGFMAGWNHAENFAPSANAVLAALVTTYATFLPSFVFVFAGAPYIERLRGNARLTAMLSGITAAVVGVVLNLAIVFAIAVIWPEGLATRPDWFAITLGIFASLLLLSHTLEVWWVILLGAVIGLGREVV
jgi:chromate transporter